MTSDSRNSPNEDEDRANRRAFYFFLGTLAFVLLAALWMLIQTAFL